MLLKELVSVIPGNQKCKVSYFDTTDHEIKDVITSGLYLKLNKHGLDNREVKVLYYSDVEKLLKILL